jgi:hypothetical protein
MSNQAINPKFTRKHYNAIYAHTEKILAVCDNVDADALRVGVRYYHHMLGKLFIEDNPNFNPEKWLIS